MAATIADKAAEVRELAARGDFADARLRLLELAEAVERADSPQTAGMQAQLPKLTRTLEVLESIDVVRNLLSSGSTEAAAEAASRILDRMSDDEYAALGISGAAITLFSRAAELARGGGNNADLDAFVSYLGSEVSELQQRRFDDPFKRVLMDPSGSRATSASTLGDLLNRQPWRTNSGLQRAVPETATKSSAAHVPVVEKPGQQGGAPVLGKILIEQEPRASAPQTQTSGAGAQADVFDVIGRAVISGWYAVLGTALVFSLIGYLIAIASPPKYQATAVLQKAQISPLRAPSTQQTANFAPAVPKEAVAEMTRMLSFHKAIEEKLKADGWAPTDGEQKGQKQPILLPTMDEVAQSLKVTVKDTGGSSYLIEFAATHADQNTARAIADTAARVFKENYRATLIREPEGNLKDYDARAAKLQRELDEIAKQRTNEFYVAPDSEAAGTTIAERIKLLMGKLTHARSQHQDAKVEVASCRLALKDFEDQLRETEPTVPNPRTASGNPQLDMLYQKRDQLYEQLIDLDRKRQDYGPKHPIHEQIASLRIQLASYDSRIKDLEDESGIRKHTIQNPSYVTASLRVKEAKAALSRAELNEKRWADEAARIETELNTLRDKYVASESLRSREAELMEQQRRNNVIKGDLESVIAAADRDLQEVQWSLRATPVEPKILVGIAVGLVLGLIVGVIIAIALLRRRKLAEAP